MVFERLPTIERRMCHCLYLTPMTSQIKLLPRTDDLVLIINIRYDNHAVIRGEKSIKFGESAERVHRCSRRIELHRAAAHFTSLGTEKTMRFHWKNCFSFTWTQQTVYFLLIRSLRMDIANNLCNDGDHGVSTMDYDIMEKWFVWLDESWKPH